MRGYNQKQITYSSIFNMWITREDNFDRCSARMYQHHRLISAYV